MSDRLLETFISIKTSLSSFGREDLRRLHDEETGAEAVQVIMIMGIMAVIVGTVFILFKDPITNLGNRIVACINGTAKSTTTGSGATATTTTKSECIFS